MTKRHALAVFYKIQEPRVRAILLFFAYLSLLAGGIASLVSPPASVEAILGSPWTSIISLFLILGGGFAAGASLPGVWWLERAGLAALETAAAMFLVNLLMVGGSPTGTRFLLLAFVAFSMFCIAARFFDIRGAQLDPKV